ncbi:hypothetical protein Tco_0354304, partial [Tanacetum coccineum]
MRSITSPLHPHRRCLPTISPPPSFSTSPEKGALVGINKRRVRLVRVGNTTDEGVVGLRVSSRQG